MKASKKILITLALVFIAIQFVPSGIPENIPEDKNSIANSNLVAGPVLDQVKKSCFDCHSNQVQFPWYAKLAPSSWLLANHIREGKSHLNFSEWEAYSNREKTGLLEDVKDEVGSGKMPLKSYLLIHRDAKLNSEETSALIKWAEEASAKLLE
ncbi:MAG: heme-binding domain-containing protein [Bacteroidales bacterium]